ncbi:MAG: NADH-ubiquinone oxidoreductase-F iron-sulfur binding region domain-containing protein [Candidatus Falkowbacteria bacterium]
MSIIAKIKKANLVGRGGAGFPTALKWESVYKAKGETKFVVINAAEGEPGVKKDGYILANHTTEMFAGVRLAMDYLGAEKCYLYINEAYYKRDRLGILKAVKANSLTKRFEFFVKPHEAGYIGGEETSILNAISGFKIEPRLKPPYPTTSGLWEMPTLIDNVETFYNVSLVEKGEYQKERFYTINGPVKNPGVYSFPNDWTIEEVLYKSGNYPKFPFFVQVGGDACGEVLNESQLGVSATGAASITIYDLEKHQPKKLLQYWINFFSNNSCGQCTPCREGTYRLAEMLQQKTVDWNIFTDLLDSLTETSFCALGGSDSTPVKSYFKNVLNNNLKKIIL